MAGPHEAIFGKLRNTAAVTAICSTRISPGIIEYGVPLPAIAYFQVSDPRDHAMGRDPNVGHPRFQIDIYSTSFAQMKALGNAVRNSLRDYTGSTWGRIQRMFYEGQLEFVDVDPETKLVTHRAAQDYIIWWNT
jgi:hypothetical protein